MCSIFEKNVNFCPEHLEIVVKISEEGQLFSKCVFFISFWTNLLQLVKKLKKILSKTINFYRKIVENVIKMTPPSTHFFL